MSIEQRARWVLLGAILISLLVHGGAFLMAMLVLWWRETANSERLGWWHRRGSPSLKPT